MDPRPLFLIGFMGAGKSAAGRALAGLLGREFVETDGLVESREGCSIAAIFERRGEEYFRNAEWQALLSLEGREQCVVATGGGLFLRREPRDWMKRRGLTVWLDVPLEVARSRIGEGAARPLWSGGDPLAQRALYERRRAVYALAAVRVAGVPGSADDVAARVRERIAGVFR